MDFILPTYVEVKIKKPIPQHYPRFTKSTVKMSDVSACAQGTLKGSSLGIQWPYELLVFNGIWKEESNAA